MASMILLLSLAATAICQERSRSNYQNAAILYEGLKWEEALGEIRLGLENAPEEDDRQRLRAVEGWCLLRLALEKNGDLEDARRAFEEALRVSGPERASIQVLLGYGMCRLELGKLRRAESATLRESVKDRELGGPELVRARQQLAVLEDDASTHLEVAAQHLEALMKNGSLFLEALVSLIETKVLQEEPEAAEQIGKAALDECVETQTYWRTEMARTGLRAFAREAERQVQASVEREIVIRETMVGVHLALGAEDLAVAEVLQFLELDPGRPLQMQGILALRYSSNPGQVAILALVRAAERSESSVELSYEAITTLGIIGPAAKDAIPGLEKLTDHDDPQIAERAKAALRQVRGR